MTGETIRPVEFRGNDFSGMEFRDVVFRGGIDLGLQRFSNGPDNFVVENAAETLRLARERLRACDDHDRREDVLLDLDLLQREVDTHHQVHIYVCASDLERDPLTRRLLVDALRG